MSARYVICLTLLLSCPLGAQDSIRIVSQNMNRFFDNIDDGRQENILSDAEFQRKMQLAAFSIVESFGLPDILALQEVENRSLLTKISQAVYRRSGVRYSAVLFEGNDVSSINNGFLVKSSFQIKSARLLFKAHRLSIDAAPLYARPPLFVEVCQARACLSLVNVHLRSMRGMRSGSKRKRVRIKRQEQAANLARWINRYQESNPGSSLMLLGDFNGLTPSDEYLDLVGIIRGKPDNSKTRIVARDWIENDLIDLTLQIPIRKRYSYLYRKKKQILDYMLVNSNFRPRLKRIFFSRIDYALSDHAALIADFSR